MPLRPVVALAFALAFIGSLHAETPLPAKKPRPPLDIAEIARPAEGIALSGSTVAGTQRTPRPAAPDAAITGERRAREDMAAWFARYGDALLAE